MINAQPDVRAPAGSSTLAAGHLDGHLLSYSFAWADGAIRAVDQRQLPHELVWLTLRSVDDVVEAVSTLAVRGAPTLGLAGAFGVALSARRHSVGGVLDRDAVEQDAARLAAARPTAVNLAGGVRRALARLDGGADGVLAEAQVMLATDEQINRRAAARASELLLACCPSRPLRIMTHCNTGGLATAGWGTALGTIADLADRGLVESVLVCETRPLLQGARLTTWELQQLGIPHRLCVDSAAAAAMAGGLVDCVVVGADRVVANGDVANKIGTYALAVAARRHGLPFVVVAPESTVDTSLRTGAEITIECRAADEVTDLGGLAVATPGTPAWNPAFDVTPAELITAVVTEHRSLPDPDALAGLLVAAMTTVTDCPDRGLTLRDLSPVYARPDLLEALTRRLADAVRGDVDAVAAGPDGLVLGAALAARLGIRLVPARVARTLPGHDGLWFAPEGVTAGDRVCVVDAVLDDDSAVDAVASLVEQRGAEVSAVAVLVDLGGVDAGENLPPYPVHSVVDLTGRRR